MAYPTDIRSKTGTGFHGIVPTFESYGSPVGAGADQSVVSVSGKAGRVTSVTMWSKSALVACQVHCDGIGVNGGYRERPDWVLQQIGGCGQIGRITLVRYDTVNEKYVYVLNGPFDFGSSFTVNLHNYDTSAKAACAVANWEENT